MKFAKTPAGKRTFKACLLGLIVWALVFGLLICDLRVQRFDYRKNPFTVGVNYPWLNYGLDIGASAWGHRGFSNAQTKQQLAEDFACLSAMGIKMVRFFVFCDGRAGIKFSADGTPLALDEMVLADFHAIVEIASRQHIYLIPVLFDYGFAKPAQMVNGVQTGGHSQCISEKNHRLALLHNVIEPLVVRFGQEDIIACWEIVNEPEWMTQLTRGRANWKVSIATMRLFISEATQLIHQVSGHKVTMGNASARWVHHFTGLGLDYYQIHFYPHIEGKSLPDLSLQDLELDKPLLLGEFPTDNGADASAFLTAARDNGYFAALAWGFNSTDRYSRFSKASPAVAQWLHTKPCLRP